MAQPEPRLVNRCNTHDDSNDHDGDNGSTEKDADDDETASHIRAVIELQARLDPAAAAAAVPEADAKRAAV